MLQEGWTLLKRRCLSKETESNGNFITEIIHWMGLISKMEMTKESQWTLRQTDKKYLYNKQNKTKWTEYQGSLGYQKD